MPVRVSADWARKKLGAAPAKRKYSNRKVRLDGILFDSQREADRYAALLMRQRAKLIRDLKLQVRFDLLGVDGAPLRSDAGRALHYLADFTYIDVPTGLMVVEDAKGMATPEYRLKKAILRAQGVEIVEV